MSVVVETPMDDDMSLGTGCADDFSSDGSTVNDGVGGFTRNDIATWIGMLESLAVVYMAGASKKTPVQIAAGILLSVKAVMKQEAVTSVISYIQGAKMSHILAPIREWSLKDLNEYIQLLATDWAKAIHKPVFKSLSYLISCLVVGSLTRRSERDEFLRHTDLLCPVI